MNSHTIRDMPIDERPRERMARHGAAVLSAHELIAIILGRGIGGESVLVTSQKLINKYGSISELLSASLEDLRQFKGMGPAKAMQILAIAEIVRRSSTKIHIEKKKTITADEASQHIRQNIQNFSKEHFIVLSFDVRNKCIGSDTITIGILDQNLVHPREVFEQPIRRHASYIIISHNHPSGDCMPSEDDVRITAGLIQGGKILGIEVVDHIIVSQHDFFSFKTHGLM